MFSSYNNQSIRKLVIAFGSLFDEIYVTRKNDTTGAEEKVKVPITFSSKEKFLKRLESNSSISDKVKTQINLPYMSFDILAVSYDPTRKRNKTLTTTTSTYTGAGALNDTQKTFSETPIQVLFNVYFYSRSLDEIFQVMEQVLPYFNPEFNIRINFNDIFKNVNVPISYREFRLIDDHEGSFSSRRMVTASFSFLASSFVFGEIKEAKVIDKYDDTIIMESPDSISDPTTQYPVYGIKINDNFGISALSLPADNTTFVNTCTWTSVGLAESITELKIAYDGTVVYSLAVPSTTSSMTANQVSSMVSAMCNTLNYCGQNITENLKFLLIIKNGSAIENKYFTVKRLECNGIC